MTTDAKNTKKIASKTKIKEYALKALSKAPAKGMTIREVAEAAKAMGWQGKANFVSTMGSTLRDNMKSADNVDGEFARVYEDAKQRLPRWFLAGQEGKAETEAAEKKAAVVEKRKPAVARTVREVKADKSVLVDTQDIVSRGMKVIEESGVRELYLDVDEKDNVLFVDGEGQSFYTDVSAAGITVSLREFMDEQFRLKLEGK